jgi:hypothetical protein
MQRVDVAKLYRTGLNDDCRMLRKPIRLLIQIASILHGLDKSREAHLEAEILAEVTPSHGCHYLRWSTRVRGRASFHRHRPFLPRPSMQRRDMTFPKTGSVM